MSASVIRRQSFVTLRHLADVTGTSRIDEDQESGIVDTNRIMEQVHTHVCVRVCVCVCVCVYVCVCVSVCVCVCVSIHTYIYIYIYIERERERGGSLNILLRGGSVCLSVCLSLSLSLSICLTQPYV